MAEKLLILLLLQAAVVLSAASITVRVDSASGNDAVCLSVLELIDQNLTSSGTACRTINRAMGWSGGVSPCSGLLENSTGILHEVDVEVTIELADGEHLVQGQQQSVNVSSLMN